jgi:Ser/Thr protein kinase RdoA (MazF antagonist)
MNGYNLKEIIGQFQVETDVSAYGEGHINDTYLATISPNKYILQRINHNIFKNPEKLMKNIFLVTEFLREKIINNGGDPNRETLTVIKTRDGKDLYKTNNGNYFRMYLYVDDANTYQIVEKKEQFYNAARAFGKFQRWLTDFPAEKLYETIISFHNTKVRFGNLIKAINEDKAGRKNEVLAEIEFALKREKDTCIIVDALNKKEIPLRVTHNDTKLNNVLFDKETDEAICVIDLDTVMPGSLLYDYGDAIRFGASSGAEDEKNLDKIYCDLELFKAFTKGFLQELGDSITKKEIELLPFSAKLMTYECGIRFLTDYLNGDTYFKIHRVEHNLDRARTQFKLVADMEEKIVEMEKIVRECI